MNNVEETLDQLRQYTIAVCKFLDVAIYGTRPNHNGNFKDGMPNGAITHYTASNSAITKNSPFGRLPVLLNRFMPNSPSKVGVQFIVWDERIPRFVEFRDRFPLLKDIPGEIFYMGMKSFWHAGWANKWAYGIEIRNIGSLTYDKKNSAWYWGKPGLRYLGRPPIEIQNHWFEPYTRSQMEATLWIHRAMASMFPIRKERFLGHVHVSSTRLDPGLHFPICEMREYTLEKPNVPIDEVPFLNNFKQDSLLLDRKDIGYGTANNEALLNAGMHRGDNDGIPDEVDLDTQEFQIGSVEGTDLQKQEVYNRLLHLGYWPGVNYNSPEFVESVKIFQARWKTKVNQRINKQTLKADGVLNEETLKRLNAMSALVGHYC